MFCFKCGADVSAQDTVCPVCGASVNQVNETERDCAAVTFLDRVKAFGIDLLVIVCIWTALFIFLWGITPWLAAPIYVLYFSLSRGTTVGMRKISARVIDEKTERPPTFLKSLIRTAVLLIFPVGFITFFFCKGSMLHDLVSGTRVIKVG